MYVDNEEWLEQLSGLVSANPSSANEEALSSLRMILFKGLSKSLGGRSGVDQAFIEDVLQEAMIKILNKLSSFEGRSKFSTWAMSIAIRTAFTELRRRHWKDVSLDEAVAGEFSLDHKQESIRSVEDSMEQKELLRNVSSLIESKLTPLQQKALFAELNGMPQEEIGSRSGSNRNAVYKLVHDARKRLKKGLVEMGYSIADLESALSG